MDLNGPTCSGGKAAFVVSRKIDPISVLRPIPNWKLCYKNDKDCNE